jgi:DNA-directed RNA polymerase subunit L
MNKKLLAAGIIFLATFSFCSAQNIGALTLFSENGEKFYLILDGLQQNNQAQANVRVEGLNKPNYNVKVVFEDKTLPPLTRNLMIEDANHAMMDVTYKIKHDKNGQPKIGVMPSSFVPYQQQAAAPAPDVYVVHYGTPDPAPATTTVQTTTTTTVSPNAQMNVGGINMQVTTPGVTTTQTTTTRTTTTETNMQQESGERREHHGCHDAYPMQQSDFSSALSSIQSQGFDETKLSTAKQIAEGNCLNTNQITEICKAFGFEETKLSYAKFAYKHCTERNNYFKVNSVFGFSSSVEELNKYIEQNR